MMSLQGPHGAIEHAAASEDRPLSPDTVWIDLDDPTTEEARRVEDTYGIRVPSRAALSEVQNSSRLKRLKHGLSLSTPMITFDRADVSLKPLGFVLTKEHLLTIRFQELHAFALVKCRIAESETQANGGVDVFLLVVEELVDALADILEEMSADLDTLSTRIFDFDVRARPGSNSEDGRHPKRRDLLLRRLLRSIGRQGKSLSKIRASLLGLERIVPFVAGECEHLIGTEAAPRFETLRRDIASLDEFETRQSETVQFLLDATLGLINSEQNNTFRILTVVSVVGIPPTLIASMYGMNFKHMPELEWAYGYPYGLALIAISALIPIVVFRIKGWV